MDPIVMLVVAAVVVALPFVLMVLFNPASRADSRGRRNDTTWRVRHERGVDTGRMPTDAGPDAADSEADDASPDDASPDDASPDDASPDEASSDESDVPTSS